MNPVPDLIHISNCGSAGNLTCDFTVSSQARCSLEQRLAIIVKIHEELQNMVNRLVGTGRKYGMEINIDISQVMRVSRSNES